MNTTTRPAAQRPSAVSLADGIRACDLARIEADLQTVLAFRRSMDARLQLALACGATDHAEVLRRAGSKLASILAELDELGMRLERER